ncbi:hypothetical protein [uncultured Pseudokineococcus sp.]|uniref:hypothetical protein n=1 Tax=uncultured Pseudokineococcus sp. TaxID=1642928 RepID=UPI002610E1A5|nr:hypothetical protein [uncultured Pseudokineococcus sp.]
MPQVPVGSQMYVGRGVNTDTGAVFGTAVAFDPPQPVDAGVGQQVVFTLESVASSRELTTKLSVATSASFKSSWGVSAEFNLTSSVTVNDYFTYALMRCRVVNAPQVLRNPVLKPEARELLIQRGWEEFAAAYGWEYVEGFVRGGSYYGLIEVQTSSRTQQQDVKAKLTGYYGVFTASAAFESELKSIARTSSVNVSVTRSGGSGEVVRSDVESMLTEAQRFPETVLEHPVPVMALTSDYRSTVPLPPLPAPNSLVRQNQRDVLNDLGRHYLRLRDAKANLEFVLARPLSDFDEYRSLEGADREATRRDLTNALRDVAVAIDEVVDRGTRCAVDQGHCQVFSPVVAMPELPTIQGELVNLRQLEEKVASMEGALREQGLLGGAPTVLDGPLSVSGDITAGAGADARLVSRHVAGKAAGADASGPLHLNWDGGDPVHVGGGQPAELAVHGDVRMDAGRSLTSPGRLHITGDEHLYLLNRSGVSVSAAWGGNGELTVDGRLGTAGRHPTQGMPSGIHGGVHTFDVVAEGVVGVGPPGEFKASMWSDGAIRGRVKQFVIDHPLRPADASLVHAAVEGPENAVFYRGSARTGPDGCVTVLLPDYFEALVRRERRSVVVTPVFTGPDAAAPLAVSPVVDGRFDVRTADCSARAQGFYWEVLAVRADVDLLEVEPPRERPAGDVGAPSAPPDR